MPVRTELPPHMSAEKLPPHEFMLYYTPRVVFVVDREWLNFVYTTKYITQNPLNLSIGGVFAPGGEMDEIIHEATYRLGDMNCSEELWRNDTTFGTKFFSSSADFSFQHIPYNPKRLNEPGYREAYCRDLGDRIEASQPDVIFLSNFKLILDPAIVERFKDKVIINVHPSVLPVLKGFRPEARAANEGEYPEHAGYTFHIVVPELDSGPVLFQQRVTIDPYDKEEEKQFENEKEYQRYREEVHRLKIIEAQARYTPHILNIAASDTPHRIVEDKEAFAAEGREGFMESHAYQEEQHRLHNEWQEKHKKEISYEEWHAMHRIPYQRVVFEKDGVWQTLESILQAPPVSDIPTPMPYRRFEVNVAVDNVPNLVELGRLAGEFYGNLDGFAYKAGITPDGRFFNASFITNRPGIDERIAEVDPNYKTSYLVAPTRVLSPRKKTTWTVESLPRHQRRIIPLPPGRAGEQMANIIFSALREQQEIGGFIVMETYCIDDGNVTRMHLETVGDISQILYSFGVFAEQLEDVGEAGTIRRQPRQTDSGLMLP